jgi:hypothetical protein
MKGLFFELENTCSGTYVFEFIIGFWQNIGLNFALNFFLQDPYFQYSVLSSKMTEIEHMIYGIVNYSLECTLSMTAVC